MKLVIVGVGAIGGAIGAYLIKGGKEKEKTQIFTVPPKAFTAVEFLAQDQPFDLLVLLCVKAHHTIEAVKCFKYLIHENSYIASFAK